MTYLQYHRKADSAVLSYLRERNPLPNPSAFCLGGLAQQRLYFAMVKMHNFSAKVTKVIWCQISQEKTGKVAFDVLMSLRFLGLGSLSSTLSRPLSKFLWN